MCPVGYRTYRDYRALDPEAFYDSLRSIPWRNIYDLNNIDDKIEFVNTNLIALLDLHAPYKTSRISKPRCPWLSPDIRNLMKQRGRALTKYKKSKTREDWESYKLLRNTVTNRLKNSKISFIRREVDGGRGGWNAFRALGLVGGRNGNIPEYLLNAEALGRYFEDCLPGGTGGGGLQVDGGAGLQTFEGVPLEFSTVSEFRVLETIASIKSAAVGFDGISVRVIAMACPFIAEYITHIINYCIRGSVFPTAWKLAAVRPVAKSGNPTLFEHLRPISVLPAMSKVLEKIILSQLQDHLRRNALLPSTQSGFRPGHSCVTALAAVSDDIFRATDCGQLTVLVLLDYSKAFDTVSHDLLISLLKYFGLSPSAGDFFREYLVGRSQYVRINGGIVHQLTLWCAG